MHYDPYFQDDTWKKKGGGYIFAGMGFPGGSNGKVSICNAGGPGLIPGLGRSLEKGTATHSSILFLFVCFTLQYSCLENPMDRGAWRFSVTKSQIHWVADTFTFHFQSVICMCVDTLETAGFLKHILLSLLANCFSPQNEKHCIFKICCWLIKTFQ